MTKRSIARRKTTWLAACVALVGSWESLQTVAYRDPIGIPTLCYGETRGIQMGMTATREQCDRMLAGGLLDFANQIERCLPVNVPDQVMVSVVSLAYNIGPGAFCASSVAWHLQAGNTRAACDALLKFNRAGGVTWRGLTNRRKAEREICLRGVA